MSAESFTLAKSANYCSGESLQELGVFGTGLPLRQVIAKLCQRLWPEKTDFELAYRVDISDRAGRDVVNGRATLSTERLAMLLRSEEGIVFLAAIMADAKPAWWVRFLDSMKLQDKRRTIRRLQQELRETMDDVDEFTATLARAEHAAAVCDEEFHRPHVDALRSMAGVQNRTVAPATSRRGK